MAGIEALDNKVEAIFGEELTSGTFNIPLAADKNFPIGKVELTIDTRNSEGLSDASGKFSPARMFQNGLLGNIKIPSSLMKVDDITAATGEIELANLFKWSGYQIVDNAGDLTLVYNGDGNCATGSGRVFNKGCGGGTTGLGTDIRGMHGSLTISAETAGAELKIDFEGQCAIEGVPDTSKTTIASDYINDAATRATELFIGTVEIDSVQTALQKMTIAMNVELMERANPEDGKNGVDFIYEANIKPTVSVTAPLGSNTATWWPNVIDGNVIPLFTYVGTYWDITMTDLVINSMAREPDGEIKLTQVLSPTTITFSPKVPV